jgi:multidrug efflux system membrane fusion protein
VPRVPTVLVLVLVLAGGGYAAYSSGVFGPQTNARAGRNAALPPVKTTIATTRDVPVAVRTIGTVLANSTVDIKSQVDGPLLSVGFREGQMVKQGDLLFRIDPAPFQAALRQTQAQVERDQAQLSSAQADADRAVMLSDRGIVSAQQRDQLVAAAKALAASISADKAAVDRAQLQLDYTTIRSPINGKTGPYLVQPGNQVHANDAAGLVVIQQIQPVKISFNLPQTDLPDVQARMEDGSLVAGVMIRSDVAQAAATASDQPNGDRDIPVKVDFIGNTVDDKTGTIELRATFNNPDLRLVPGELVDVSVRLDTLKNAVVVPRDGVNIGQSGNYVYVIDKDKKAQTRPVQVLYQDETIAALGTGIQAGDQVVTDGQLRLTPGIEVSVVGQDKAPDTVQPKNVDTAPNTSASPSADPASGVEETAGRRGARPRG